MMKGKKKIEREMKGNKMNDETERMNCRQSVAIATRRRLLSPYVTVMQVIVHACVAVCNHVCGKSLIRCLCWSV